MKAATGELNLTVITIVAIAAVIGFFTWTMWPTIQKTIGEQWEHISEDTQHNEENRNTNKWDNNGID